MSSSTAQSSRSPYRSAAASDGIRVAPYLTHHVTHHGQITLIPPENAGRMRKTKKKRAAASRPVTERTRSSASHDRQTVVTVASAGGSGSAPTSESPTDSRPPSRGEAARSRARMPSICDSLAIPDSPPPSFLEAISATPSIQPLSRQDCAQNSSAPASTYTGMRSNYSLAPTVFTQDTPPPTPYDRVPSNHSSSSSAASHEPESEEEAESDDHTDISRLETLTLDADQTRWSDDLRLGVSLEQRVKREKQRQMASELALNTALENGEATVAGPSNDATLDHEAAACKHCGTVKVRANSPQRSQGSAPQSPVEADAGTRSSAHSSRSIPLLHRRLKKPAHVAPLSSPTTPLSSPSSFSLTVSIPPTRAATPGPSSGRQKSPSSTVKSFPLSLGGRKRSFGSAHILSSLNSKGKEKEARRASCSNAEGLDTWELVDDEVAAETPTTPELDLVEEFSPLSDYPSSSSITSPSPTSPASPAPGISSRLKRILKSSSKLNLLATTGNPSRLSDTQRPSSPVAAPPPPPPPTQPHPQPSYPTARQEKAAMRAQSMRNRPTPSSPLTRDQPRHREPSPQGAELRVATPALFPSRGPPGDSSASAPLSPVESPTDTRSIKSKKRRPPPPPPPRRSGTDKRPSSSPGHTSVPAYSPAAPSAPAPIPPPLAPVRGPPPAPVSSVVSGPNYAMGSSAYEADFPPLSSPASPTSPTRNWLSPNSPVTPTSLASQRTPRPSLPALNSPITPTASTPFPNGRPSHARSETDTCLLVTQPQTQPQVRTRLPPQLSPAVPPSARNHGSYPSALSFPLPPPSRPVRVSPTVVSPVSPVVTSPTSRTMASPTSPTVTSPTSRTVASPISPTSPTATSPTSRTVASPVSPTSPTATSPTSPTVTYPMSPTLMTPTSPITGRHHFYGRPLPQVPISPSGSPVSPTLHHSRAEASPRHAIQQAVASSPVVGNAERVEESNSDSSHGHGSSITGEGHSADNSPVSNHSGYLDVGESVLEDPGNSGDHFQYTDLDVLVSRLDERNRDGSNYDTLLLVSEVIGPASPPHPNHVPSNGSGRRTAEQTESSPFVGRIEIHRRRVLKDGRVKLKLSLLGVPVDRCGICLSQFREAQWAALGPTCQHAFHSKCLRNWLERSPTCPLCRVSVKLGCR